MFKDFNGNEVEKAQALLGVKVLKIVFETGFFMGAFEYTMDKVNPDVDKKSLLEEKLESLTSLMETYNDESDFTEEFWNKMMNINKEIYEIFGLTEEEYYAYSVEYSSKNEELTTKTVMKQMELLADQQ